MMWAAAEVTGKVIDTSNVEWQYIIAIVVVAVAGLAWVGWGEWREGQDMKLMRGKMEFECEGCKRGKRGMGTCAWHGRGKPHV